MLLHKGNRQAQHRHVVTHGETDSGGSIAATDVTYGMTGLQLEPGLDQSYQRLGSFGSTFTAATPVAVMDMVSPDAPVGRVEFVVVHRDLGHRLRNVGNNHHRTMREPRPAGKLPAHQPRRRARPHAPQSHRP